MIFGKPGTGKSALVRMLAQWATDFLSNAGLKDKTVNLIMVNAVSWSAEDINGVLMKVTDSSGYVSWVPMERLHTIINTKEPTIVELQDFGQWDMRIQKTLMPALDRSERTWAGHKIPNCVMLIATTNDKDDRAGVGNILQTVQGRFTNIIGMNCTVAEYCNWASENLHEYVSSFLKIWGEDLNAFRNTTNTLSKGFCFRTMEMLSDEQKLIDANVYGDDNEMQKVAIQSCVGMHLGLKYWEHLINMRNLCDVTDIIKNPKLTPLPKNNEMMAKMPSIIHSLIESANSNDIRSINTYIMRVSMQDNCAGWGAIFWHNVLRKFPEFKKHESHTDWLSHRKEQDSLYTAKWSVNA